MTFEPMDCTVSENMGHNIFLYRKMIIVEHYILIYSKSDHIILEQLSQSGTNKLKNWSWDQGQEEFFRRPNIIVVVNSPDCEHSTKARHNLGPKTLHAKARRPLP